MLTRRCPRCKGTEMVPTSYGRVSCGTCGDTRECPRGRVPFHVGGWRFKKVTWNWTSLIIGVHAGRNPATGARFAYIGLGYGLGLDFYRPEEGKK